MMFFKLFILSFCLPSVIFFKSKKLKKILGKLDLKLFRIYFTMFIRAVLYQINAVEYSINLDFFITSFIGQICDSKNVQICDSNNFSKILMYFCSEITKKIRLEI